MMRFRNLDYPRSTPVERLGPAAIDDLLERGDLDAWAPLARAVRGDPWGSLAATILHLCKANPMYGTSPLWIAWIERLRSDRAERGGIGLVKVRTLEGVTQQQVAQKMGISQSDVSKLERRTDVKVSTLSAYVAALGGELRVLAEIPGHAAIPLSVRRD